ncbi:unnamed protein product, partial [Callosobruchus maculatus]
DLRLLFAHLQLNSSPIFSQALSFSRHVVAPFVLHSISCLYFSTNEMDRCSSSFEKLFALFGSSMLTHGHMHGYYFKKAPEITTTPSS